MLTPKKLRDRTHCQSAEQRSKLTIKPGGYMIDRWIIVGGDSCFGTWRSFVALLMEMLISVDNISWYSWPSSDWVGTTPGNYIKDGEGQQEAVWTLAKSILIGILLSSVTLATVIGNLLVILSVCLDRHLHSPPNILIVNLAVADLMVGVLVMPFAIADLVGRPWIWIDFICDIYVSSDVLSCTGSIVTLCMISVDRYMAITRPFKYASKRTPRLMLGMVLFVWVVGAFIALSPFIWGGNVHGAPDENLCLLSQETVFTIYSTFGAFYLPLVVMLIVYYKIYRAAKRSEKAEMQRRPSIFPTSLPGSRRGSADDAAGAPHPNDPYADRRKSIYKFAEYIVQKARPSIVSIRTNGSVKSRISLKGERKAAKTLGVIMGAFTFCWLPFFLLAFVRPFCGCEIPALLDNILLWLGYTNSAINPVIYPFFNKDFAPAYKRLLSCKFLFDKFERKRSPLYDRRGSMSHHYNHKPTKGSCDRYQDLTAIDLLNCNDMFDRRPSDLDRISEVSAEGVCEV